MLRVEDAVRELMHVLASPPRVLHGEIIYPAPGRLNPRVATRIISGQPYAFDSPGCRFRPLPRNRRKDRAAHSLQTARGGQRRRSARTVVRRETAGSHLPRRGADGNDRIRRLPRHQGGRSLRPHPDRRPLRQARRPRKTPTAPGRTSVCPSRSTRRRSSTASGDTSASSRATTAARGRRLVRHLLARRRAARRHAPRPFPGRLLHPHGGPPAGRGALEVSFDVPETCPGRTVVAEALVVRMSQEPDRGLGCRFFRITAGSRAYLEECLLLLDEQKS